MKVIDYFFERFGIEKAVFDGFGIYAGLKGKIYLGPKKLIEKPNLVTPGVLIARDLKTVKPSTNFIQLFGHLAKKNFVELSKDDAVRFMKGEDLALEKTDAENGYVVVRYENYSLGCGFLEDKNLRNQVPKAKRVEVTYL